MVLFLAVCVAIVVALPPSKYRGRDAVLVDSIVLYGLNHLFSISYDPLCLIEG